MMKPEDKDFLERLRELTDQYDEYYGENYALNSKNEGEAVYEFCAEVISDSYKE